MVFSDVLSNIKRTLHGTETTSISISFHLFFEIKVAQEEVASGGDWQL